MQCAIKKRTQNRHRIYVYTYSFTRKCALPIKLTLKLAGVCLRVWCDMCSTFE